MLKSLLTPSSFIKLLLSQFEHFYPDNLGPEKAELEQPFEQALARYYQCCKGLTRKYFTEGDDVFLSHLNTDQYAMFLYLLSQELHKAGHVIAAEKAYALNKALHGIDIFYTVQMPEKFMFSHCVGSVLGHAVYGNYFRVGQNCTVGTEGNKSPVIGEGVALYKGAIITGDSVIGNNVHVSANSFIRRAKIPDNVVVYGSSTDLTFKPSNLTVKERFFYSGLSGSVPGVWHTLIE